VRDFEITVVDGVEGELTFDASEAGPTDGELVLLLHGFPQNRLCYRAQLEALGAAGYHAVAFDQRGYSPRARPAEISAYTGPRLAADVVAVADALGAERFHLVGHDWGGAIAWQTAGRYPDRVATLTVLSTPHPMAFGMALMSGETDQQDRSSYIQIFRAEGTEHGMLANDATGLRALYAASGLSPEQAAPYLEALSTPEALGAALNWYRGASLEDIQGLGPITMPTLYVWSTGDPALGREAAEATAQFVEGPYTFEVLDGVSHWIAEQAPEQTNEVLLAHLATSR
jgi:pimeloyl-ACP methyl ester carboxylesterase